MNRRTIKTIVVAASIVGLSGATAATAWADTFTPGIEEPTADLGLPGGNGNDLTGSTPLGGNKSSAAGTNGKTYGSGYSSSYGSTYDDESMNGSADDRSDHGYWRSGSSRSHDDSYGYDDSDGGY
jgi:hypothetical protein